MIYFLLVNSEGVNSIIIKYIKYNFSLDTTVT